MSTTGLHQEPLDVLAQLGCWLHNGRRVALATVVQTWGSSPRPEGSHLAVDGEGNFVGSVSGGCIEGAVVAEALEIIAGAKPRLLEFGVSDDQAWEVGLSCGGAIHVYVESVDAQTIEQLLAARAQKRSVAQVTRLQDGCATLLYDDELRGDLPLDASRLSEARTLLRSGRSGVLQRSESTLFVRSYVPRKRLILVGAVHIAQVLAPMATLAGYEVTVIDPRTAFGRQERFSNVTVSNDWPDEGLEKLALDSQSAVVTLSHDPKIDDPALAVALRSPAFYIGSLGSTRTHARRVERLTALGLGGQLHRIHGPVGIPLGGRAPAEIAVSILAQVIQARHGVAERTDKESVTASTTKTNSTFSLAEYGI